MLIIPRSFHLLFSIQLAFSLFIAEFLQTKEQTNKQKTQTKKAGRSGSRQVMKGCGFKHTGHKKEEKEKMGEAVFTRAWGEKRRLQEYSNPIGVKYIKIYFLVSP